ncbi:hypothetical protein V462_11135 [Pantoea ananatis 15320]|nr:hypothetical protein V462_11135 [Pantoea ananatis 15320]
MNVIIKPLKMKKNIDAQDTGNMVCPVIAQKDRIMGNDHEQGRQSAHLLYGKNIHGIPQPVQSEII